MKIKRLKTIGLVLANIVMLYSLIIVVRNVKYAGMFMDIGAYNFYTILKGLIFLVFGLLIESDRLYGAFRNGFKINIVYFITAIIILALAVSPLYVLSLSPYGYGIIISIRINEMLTYPEIRCLFSFWSGVLISRSLTITS